MKKIFLSILTLLTLNSYAQVLVKNISPGLSSSSPHCFYPFKNGFVFGADNSFNGIQLYYTDGTASGTVMLTQFTPLQGGNGQVEYDMTVFANARVGNFTEIDSMGYFFGLNWPYGYNFYKTNGTMLGTQSILTPSVNFDYGSKFFKMQNNICALVTLAPCNNCTTPNFILKYDPNTNAVTFTPLKIWPITDYYNPQNWWANYNANIKIPYVYNNKLYGFKTADSLFTEDINGNLTFVTQTLGRLPGGAGWGGAFEDESIIVNGKYLIYTTPANPSPSSIGDEPYYFEFATNTFGLLKDINPYFNYSSDVSFSHFPYLDTKNHQYAYFMATNPDYGREVWVTDGTSAGTHITQETGIGPLDGTVEPVLYHGDSCYGFQVSTQTSSLILITTNAITTSTSYSGMLGSYYIWSTGNNTFFLDKRFSEIYIYNQLSGFPIDSLDPLTCNFPSMPFQYTGGGAVIRINNNLYFSYNDCNVTGEELYKLDISLLSVNENSFLNPSILIYPNPFSTSTTLQTESFLQNAALTVYNFLGQTVAQIKNINGQTVTFSRDNLASGLYFIRLTEENKTIAVDKLVITDK